MKESEWKFYEKQSRKNYEENLRQKINENAPLLGASRLSHSISYQKLISKID